MTDSQTRHQARDAATGDVHAKAVLIRQQLRSMTYLGIGPRGTECHAWEEGERACPELKPDPLRHVRMDDLVSRRDLDCALCNGTGTLPSDPRDAVRLMAYWGCDASRLVIPSAGRRWRNKGKGAAWHVQTWGMQDAEPCFAAGLLRLAAKLPPLRLVGGVECNGCRGVGSFARDLNAQGQASACGGCSGTGRKPYVVPMDRWVEARVAVQVADSCFDGWVCQCVSASDPMSGCWECVPVRAAIDAARCWLQCPCPPNERAWHLSPPSELTNYGERYIPWVPSPDRELHVLLGAAQSLIGEPAVRQAILGARP